MQDCGTFWPLTYFSTTTSEFKTPFNYHNLRIQNTLQLPQVSKMWSFGCSSHKILFVNTSNEITYLLSRHAIALIERYFLMGSLISRRMKPSRCCTWGFSSLKRILKVSQTWKLPIGIFVHWKVLQHSMQRFSNKFL